MDIAPEQGIALVAIALVSAIVLLMMLGAGSRFVVFATMGDFVASFVMALLGIALIPLAIWASKNFPAPTEVGLFYEAVRSSFSQHLVTSVLVTVGLITFVWTALRFVGTTVAFNGLIAGLFLIVLKLTGIVGLIASIVISPIIGFLLFLLKSHWDENFRPESSRRREERGILYYLFWGFIGWCGSRMVNGARVMAARGYGAEADEEEALA